VIFNIIKYTALIAYLKHYKKKIYIAFSIVALFFLVDYIYSDVQEYLREAYPDYEMIALLIKSVLVVMLFILLLILFKPTTHSSLTSNSMQSNAKNNEIIKAVKEKDKLSSNLNQHELNKSHKPSLALSDEDRKILEEVKNKKKLESKADMIIKGVTKK